MLFPPPGFSGNQSWTWNLERPHHCCHIMFKLLWFAFVSWELCMSEISGSLVVISRLSTSVRVVPRLRHRCLCACLLSVLCCHLWHVCQTSSCIWFEKICCSVLVSERLRNEMTQSGLSLIWAEETLLVVYLTRPFILGMFGRSSGRQSDWPVRSRLQLHGSRSLSVHTASAA